MKRIVKILSSVMVAVLLISASSIGAFAETSNVIFENEAEKFIFLPGSEYTDTDLFDNFKNIMPGDTRSQTIVISNNYKKFNKIKIFLKAVPHGNGNALSDSVAAQETLESMNDFLSKLHMTVRQGNRIIFSGSPNETDGLTNSVDLGSIAYGETIKLKVEITMPAELDNAYANRIGEVDWVFTVQQETSTIIIPTITQATISAIKLLDGNVPNTNEFLFELVDSDGKVIQLANNKGAEVIFNSIRYTMPGVYTYYIREVPGNNAEMTYDDSVYTVTVSVGLSGLILNASVSYSKDGISTGVPTFCNTTEKEKEDEDIPLKPVKVSLWATKTLNQHLAVENSFVFNLSDENGNLIQQKNNSGGYIFFNRLTFDKVGTYTYYITEEKGDVEGMIYDSGVFKVTVTVFENGEELDAVVSYEKNALSYNDNPNFANFTENDPEIPPTSDSDTVWFVAAAVGGAVTAIVVVMVAGKRKAK